MTGYLLISVSVLLFASQFVFNRSFEKEEGSSFGASMLFSLLTSVFGFAISFVIAGFKLQITSLSLFYAVLYAVFSVAYSVASVKSFGSVNLSVYSIFAMLGGMILPSVCGILIFKESLTVYKLICYAAVVGALLLTVDLRQMGGDVKWYFGVFVLNGTFGVLSVLHQNGENTVSSLSFLMLARIASTVISLVLYLFVKKDTTKVTKKALFDSFMFAAVNGIGNLLLLTALKQLPASVQYPIVTGGVMIVSLLIDLLRKENISKKNAVATAVAFAASVAIAF